jgi:hypothetical protein
MRCMPHVRTASNDGVNYPVARVGRSTRTLSTTRHYCRRYPRARTRQRSLEERCGRNVMPPLPGHCASFRRHRPLAPLPLSLRHGAAAECPGAARQNTLRKRRKSRCTAIRISRSGAGARGPVTRKHLVVNMTRSLITGRLLEESVTHRRLPCARRQRCQSTHSSAALVTCSRSLAGA